MGAEASSTDPKVADELGEGEPHEDEHLRDAVMLGQATPSLNDAPGPNALDQSKEWERVTREIEIASRALSKCP